MNTKQRLRSQCDKLWFQRYLQPQCEVCGKIAIQCHHFVPKSISAVLRYDPKNSVSLCMGCHFAHHHKGDPAIHETIRQKRGKKWWDYLAGKRKAITPNLLTLKYYQDIIKQLQ